MLASRMLAREVKEKHDGALARAGGMLAAIYKRSLAACLNAPLIVIVVGAVLSIGAYGIFTQITQEITPREDRSVVLLRATTPQGASLDYTRDQMQLLEAKLQPLIQSGEVRSMFSISGQGGSKNSAFMVLTLARWNERERSQAAIAADVTKAAASVPTLQAFAIQPNSLGIRGGGSGLQVALAGNDYDQLSASAQELINAMSDSGEFENVRLNTEATQAQLTISVDRERASDLGIDITGLSTALQALLDGRSIGDVYVDGVAVPVTILSSSNPLDDPMDLENIFLKTGDGRTVPMSTIATLGADTFARVAAAGGFAFGQPRT
jgi:hydrophobic/amphiphilic exporter-1 (mainly G- bacteria), HAE1 family